MPTALGVNVKHEAFPVIDQKPKITPARAANPSLLAYAQRIFGTLDLDEDQWKQCEEQIKVREMLFVRHNINIFYAVHNFMV